MLEITILQTYGWEAAIRGMRNPMNSWDKSDTILYKLGYYGCDDCPKKGEDCSDLLVTNNGCLEIGPNDLDLACRLIKAGPEHCKFLRMIHVQMDITGPLYWWKEMDTYKVGTTTNSCSTMHRITSKEFTSYDFSCEHLIGYDEIGPIIKVTPIKSLSEYSKISEQMIEECNISEILPMGTLFDIIEQLNSYRKLYLKTKDKKYWWQLIQLLPSSYNQLRTWDASMQTVLSILHQRHNHKLDEWRKFTDILLTELPYLNIFYEAMKGDNQVWA